MPRARRKAQTQPEPIADAPPSSAAHQRAAAESSRPREQVGDSPRLEQAPPLASTEIASDRTVFDVLEDGREQLTLLARSVADGARAALRLTQLSLELASWPARVGRARST